MTVVRRKTRMEKFVLDAGWGMLRVQLQYGVQQAGGSVRVVSETNTSRTRLSCRAVTGPTGVNRLSVRTWACSELGDIHDRNVKAHGTSCRGEVNPFRLREGVVGSIGMPAPGITPAQRTDSADRHGGLSTGSQL